MICLKRTGFMLQLALVLEIATIPRHLIAQVQRPEQTFFLACQWQLPAVTHVPFLACASLAARGQFDGSSS